MNGTNPPTDAGGRAGVLDYGRPERERVSFTAWPGGGRLSISPVTRWTGYANAAGFALLAIWLVWAGFSVPFLRAQGLVVQAVCWAGVVLGLGVWVMTLAARQIQSTRVWTTVTVRDGRIAVTYPGILDGAVWDAEASACTRVVAVRWGMNLGRAHRGAVYVFRRRRPRLRLAVGESYRPLRDAADVLNSALSCPPPRWWERRLA